MASNADGSIRIDTELDNSGFQRGSDKLLDALKRLQSSVDAISDTLSNGMDAVIKTMQALASQAGSTVQTVSQAADANQKVADTANAAAEATRAMGSAGGLRNVNTAFDQIGRTAAGLHDQITRLATTADIGFKNDGQILRFRDSVDIVSRKVEELEAKLQALGNTKIPTSDYQFLQNEVQKTEKALERLLDRQQKLDETGARQGSASYKRLTYDIENAQRAIETMKAEMADMEANGEAFTLGSDTAEYANMSGVLAQLKSELSGVQSASSAAQLELSSLASTNPILSALATAAKAAASAVGRIFSGLAKGSAMAFTAVIKNLGKALATVAGKAKSAAASILGIGKNANRGINPVNRLISGLTSMRRMLITRLKRTFISQIFNSIKESMQAFAQYSSAFNQAMSNIKNTGSELGGNFAAFFANLLAAIEPIVTRILSLINSLVTALSALFARFSGKSTVSVASKQTGSYADSLDKAASSAGGAAKAQKKFNAELYGWDELTKQSKQDDSSGGGGGGAAAMTWKEVPVDDILGKWEDIDWEKKGFDFAEKMADALDSIPWDKIKSAASRIGTHLAELLNGVFSNLHFATSLGTTIAEGLNTALNFVYSFLNKFDFKKFGTFLGTIWNTLINKFDFEKLRKSIAKGGNGVVKAIKSFLETTEGTCEKLGKGIASFINGIFADIDFGEIMNTLRQGLKNIHKIISSTIDNIDWDKIIANIGKGMDGIFNFIVEAFNNIVKDLSKLVKKINWKELGKNLINGLKDAIKKIDWASFGDTVGSLYLGAIDLLTGILEDADLGEIVLSLFNGLLDAFQNMDWAKIGSKLGNLLGKALQAALDLAVDLITNIDKWLPKLLEIGGNIIAGLLAGIWNAMVGIFDWIKEHIIDPIVDAVCWLFGIESPSTVFAEIGENLILGLLKGLKAVWNLIVGFFEKAIEWIVGIFAGAWEAIKTAASVAWKAITGVLKTAWNGIQKAADWVVEGIANTWKGLKKTVSAQCEYMYNAGATLADKIYGNTDSKAEQLEKMVNKHAGIISNDVAQALIETNFDVDKAMDLIDERMGRTAKSCDTSAQKAAEATAKHYAAIYNTTNTESQKAATATAKHFQDIYGSVENKSREAAASAAKHFQAIYSSTDTKSKEAAAATAKHFQAIYSSTYTKSKDAATAAAKHFEAIYNTANNKSDEAAKASAKHFTALYGSVDSKMSDVEASVGKHINASTKKIKDTDWEPLGKNLGAGLGNGLQSAFSTVAKKISEMMSGLERKAKEAADVHSPSRVWAQIGQFLGLGLLQGMESEKKALFSTTEALADGINERMTVSGDVQLGTGDTVSNLDVILGKLSQVAQIITQIGKTITTMGGLDIPAIAQGTVMPYRARVAAATTAGSTSYSAMNDNSETANLLRRVIELMQQGGSGSGDVRVIVDGKEIMSVIVRENERAIQRTGRSPIRV